MRPILRVRVLGKKGNMVVAGAVGRPSLDRSELTIEIFCVRKSQ